MTARPFEASGRGAPPFPRVLVVEHQSDAGLGILAPVLRRAGARLTVVGPDAGSPPPADLAGYDGLIVLGGTPGPVDDDVAPWLPAVRALLREALDAALPCLGVCLGAQLLAVVAGGHVAGAVHPEVGLVRLELTAAGAADPLLGALAGDIDGFAWHFLEVSALPAGSVSLCRSDRCDNQAFRVGPVAWGLQFHLEADAETAARWSADSPAGLRALSLTPPDVIAPMAVAQSRLARQWAVVAERWLDVVRGAAEDPKAHRRR